MFEAIRALLGGSRRGSSTTLSVHGAQLLLQGKAVLLDVRTAAERRLAYIPGSLHIPLDELDELPARQTELSPGTTVICQCASGHRSLTASRFLSAQGLDARSLRGAEAAPQAAGLPVTGLA